MYRCCNFKYDGRLGKSFTELIAFIQSPDSGEEPVRSTSAGRVHKAEEYQCKVSAVGKSQVQTQEASVCGVELVTGSVKD